MNKLTPINKNSINAIVLFLTGFFLIQVLLSNFLYVQHPHGGWVTALGNMTTSTIFYASLFALSLCLLALWRSASNGKPIKHSTNRNTGMANHS
ncbi:MAG: hypothetical protein V3U71_11890 [Cocleimonas sp.]